MSRGPISRFVLRPLARALVRLRIPSDGVTLLSLLLASAAAAALVTGRGALGGAGIVAAALCGALPGELARLGRPGALFGKVVHAVAARYAEAAALGGMTVYAVRFEDWPRPEAIGALALAASLTVAYASARIEASLGTGGRTSAPGAFLAAQDARWAIAAVGAFSGQCYWALVALAALGTAVAAWRLAYLRFRGIGVQP